jgi:phospholipid/cholesterol/gamma-HCH transport system ATP-binding protein
MIQVQNLSKAFGEKQIIKDISIDFIKGKVNIIIGESGSGKTVLSKLMVGLMEPDSGKVIYD